MKNALILTLLLGTFIQCASKKKETSHTKTPQQKEPFIEQIDPSLSDILDATTEVKIIADGFEWVEGPLWLDGVGLIFSEIPQNRINLWTEDGKVKTYLSPSGYTDSLPRGGEVGSNGLALNNRGELVLCQHGDRRMAVMEAPTDNPKPVFRTVADRFNGKRFNSPNDACYSRSGVLYFTDPPYGLENKMDDPSKEIDFQGVYRVDAHGKLSLFTDELTRPNGIALSPDDHTLYVANSDPSHAVWMAYTLNDQGEILQEKIFFDVTSIAKKEKGLPDGLKVDQHGNLFATGPGGVWIFNSSGKVLGKIHTGQATSNCAFGKGGKYLFMTADMCIMQVALK